MRKDVNDILLFSIPFSLNLPLIISLVTEQVVTELVDKLIVMETLVPEMVAHSDSAELQLHGLTIFILAG